MIADQYDTVFKDGSLTELMIIKRKDRRNVSKRVEYPLFKLLKSFLRNYGIGLGGGVYIGDYFVQAVTIGTDFNLKNELVLKQLYNFTGGKVNIQLSLEIKEDAAFAFWYDLTDYSCTFVKYFLGSTAEEIEFDKLEAMMHFLKKREAAAK